MNSKALIVGVSLFAGTLGSIDAGTAHADIHNERRELRASKSCQFFTTPIQRRWREQSLYSRRGRDMPHHA